MLGPRSGTKAMALDPLRANSRTLPLLSSATARRPATITMCTDRQPAATPAPGILRKPAVAAGLCQCTSTRTTRRPPRQRLSAMRMLGATATLQTALSPALPPHPLR